MRHADESDTSSMELHYFRTSGGNFGDDLNGWFWDDLLPGWSERHPGSLMVGIGTLINNSLPAGAPKLVMGSGVGYGTQLSPGRLEECRIVALRGPASARSLGLPEALGVIDPAALLPGLPRFAGLADAPRRGPPLFVPHFTSSERYDWPAICAAAGLAFLSPRSAPEEVIRQLAQAPLVIAESLHAAIISDSFRTPWHAISLTPEFNDFKWADWAESLEMPLTMHRPLWERLGGRVRPASGPEGGRAAAAKDPARAQAQGAQGRAGSPALWPGLRDRLKAGLLGWQLRRLAARPGQLSDAAILAARQAELRHRFAAALEAG